MGSDWQLTKQRWPLNESCGAQLVPVGKVIRLVTSSCFGCLNVSRGPGREMTGVVVITKVQGFRMGCALLLSFAAHVIGI